jgi:hypothetical protein
VAHQDVFAAAAKAGDPGAGQAVLQVLGKRPAQVGAVRGGAHDEPPLQPLAEALHHGFDFGEFRHLSSTGYTAAS